MTTRYHALAILVAALLGLAPLGLLRAQERTRAFPETGHSVGGQFLSYWERNGGLPVFGYPLSDRLQEAGRDAQYFERQRFEAHPEYQAPYNVLLGRLGDELLRLRGTSWQTDVPPAAALPGCLYFSETRHNVCDQGPGAGFRSYWAGHGLEFDGRAGKSYAESLALFGYPLTEVYTESVEGQQLQVQWFERARFEWHPGNPTAHRVLLGRLGAELLQAQGPRPGTVSQVQLYFVAVDDNGRTGQKIGCGDSLIPVTRQIAPTTMPLTSAYAELLSLHDQYYGQSGLYNALYQSRLAIDRVVVAQGEASVALTGELRLGGVCDSPRAQAQLEQVALQFPTVQRVAITINGTPLADVLSQR